MRIIEEGIKLEDRIVKIRCEKCSTLFEFQLKEANKVNDYKIEESFYIKCPICNQSIYFD